MGKHAFLPPNRGKSMFPCDSSAFWWTLSRARWEDCGHGISVEQNQRIRAISSATQMAVFDFAADSSLRLFLSVAEYTRTWMVGGRSCFQCCCYERAREHESVGEAHLDSAVGSSIGSGVEVDN